MTLMHTINSHQSVMAGGIFIPNFNAVGLQRKGGTMDLRLMELKDTIIMMQSKDYRERFRAEYCQAVIRFDKLNQMLKK